MSCRLVVRSSAAPRKNLRIRERNQFNHLKLSKSFDKSASEIISQDMLVVNCLEIQLKIGQSFNFYKRFKAEIFLFFPATCFTSVCRHCCLCLTSSTTQILQSAGHREVILTIEKRFPSHISNHFAVILIVKRSS